MKKILVVLLALFFSVFVLAVENYEGQYKIQDTSNNVHRVNLVDVQIPYTYTFIGQEGFIGLRQPNNTIFLYGRNSVPRYNTTNTNNPLFVGCGVTACDPADSCSVLGNVFESAAGELDGVDMINQTMTLRYRTKYTKIPRPPVLVSIINLVEHVDVNGGTTTLDSFGQSITQTETNYTRSFTVNQSWSVNEKIRNTITYHFNCEIGFSEEEENDSIIKKIQDNFAKVIGLAYKGFFKILGGFSL